MADEAKGAEKADAPKEVKLEDLAKTFGMAKKLVSRMADAQLFKDAEVEPDEWNLLYLVAEGEQTRSKLARDMGISGREVDSMARGMASRGLVTSKTATSDPAKRAV